MQNPIKTYLYILIFMIIIPVYGFAQTFDMQAKVKSVDKASYYKIFISPEITSRLHHAFPDLRLYDEDGNEIQYILKQQKTIYDRGKKNELKIIKNKYKKFKHFTELVVENEEKTEISNMIFSVINTHNPVFIKISGSNDNKKWYILKNNYPAVPDISNADTTEIKVMNIPKSNFKYFKILFHDYDEKNIKVNKVFYHDLADIRAEYVQLPKPVLTQKDTLGKSIVTIEFSEPQFIDMLTFGIQGPEFYLRKVRMQKNDTASSLSLPGETFYDQMDKDFWFGSLMSNRINLADYKARKITFIIDNKDNQPLKIYKINAYQLKNYMVTYLKPDIKYHILFGSESANFPNYDLPYFKDTIPENLPETYFYDIRKNENSGNKVKTIWNFPPEYLWRAIGAAGIILLIVSILLLKQKSRNNPDKNRKTS